MNFHSIHWAVGSVRNYLFCSCRFTRARIFRPKKKTPVLPLRGLGHHSHSHLLAAADFDYSHRCHPPEAVSSPPLQACLAGSLAVILALPCSTRRTPWPCPPLGNKPGHDRCFHFHFAQTHRPKIALVSRFFALNLCWHPLFYLYLDQLHQCSLLEYCGGFFAAQTEGLLVRLLARALKTKADNVRHTC